MVERVEECYALLKTFKDAGFPDVDACCRSWEFEVEGGARNEKTMKGGRRGLEQRRLMFGIFYFFFIDVESM